PIDLHASTEPVLQISSQALAQSRDIRVRALLEIRVLRQGDFAPGSGSQLHTLTAKLNSYRLSGTPSQFNQEHPRATRPFVHSLVRFDREAPGSVIPAEADPNRLRVGAIAIAETSTVIVIKREGAVRAG